jgi:CheY-like chemotaxis protein
MKPTILIVDDQPGTRRLLRNVLEADGYAVVEAADEPGAWRAVVGCDESLGLALIDVDLPGLKGRYVAEHLQMLRPLPVVFMSGHSHDALVAGGEITAGTPWLAKPFRLSDVRQAVGRELQ